MPRATAKLPPSYLQIPLLPRQCRPVAARLPPKFRQLLPGCPVTSRLSPSYRPTTAQLPPRYSEPPPSCPQLRGAPAQLPQSCAQLPPVTAQLAAPYRPAGPQLRRGCPRLRRGCPQQPAPSDSPATPSYHPLASSCSNHPRYRPQQPRRPRAAPNYRLFASDSAAKLLFTCRPGVPSYRRAAT